MTRRDISLTLALCASLTLHALMLGTAAEWYTLRVGPIWLPGFPRQADAMGLLVVPALPEPRPDTEEDPMQRLGDSSGAGKAIAESPGELPMQARQATQDQPFLSLDPAGPGKIGEDPTDSTIPLGRAGSPAPPTAAAPLAAPPVPGTPPAQQESPTQLAAVTPPPAAAAPPMPFGMGPNAKPEMNAPFVKPPDRVETVDSVELAEQPTNVQATVSKPAPDAPPDPQALTLATSLVVPPLSAPLQPQPRPQPPSPPSAVDQQLPAQPGADKAADPAPMGGTESDPSTTIGSVDFRPGATQVRLGRKFKLTRPRLSLASSYDLISFAAPTVVLKLTIDERGDVVSADVYRSSGSTNVDQPCQIAAYSWWFEPTKDKSGKPTKDVILFTIRFF